MPVSPEVGPVLLGQVPLICVVCKHDQFAQAAWKLNTTGAELFDLAWANKNASCYICARCRYIHWFYFD